MTVTRWSFEAENLGFVWRPDGVLALVPEDWKIEDEDEAAPSKRPPEIFSVLKTERDYE